MLLLHYSRRITASISSLMGIGFGKSHFPLWAGVSQTAIARLHSLFLDPKFVLAIAPNSTSLKAPLSLSFSPISTPTFRPAHPLELIRPQKSVKLDTELNSVTALGRAARSLLQSFFVIRHSSFLNLNLSVFTEFIQCHQQHKP
jgi:hypothetical protein